MFCPKCGAENADTNKFCRTCRENLQMISQAMKKRLPVLLASRIDALLDRRSERFRRNSFLFLILGLGCLFAGFFSVFSRSAIWQPILFFSITAFCIQGSIWDYLAYRYSLELGEPVNPEPVEAEGGLSDGLIQTLGLTDPTPVTKKIKPQPKSEPSFAFCPRCGLKVQETTKNCRGCGINFDKTLSAMRPGWFRSMINSWLDRYVTRASDVSRIHRAAKVLLRAGVYFLFLGVIDLFDSNPKQWVSIGHLTLGFIFSFVGLWDYLGSRRWREAQEPLSGDIIDNQQEIPLHVATTNELELPASSVEPFVGITEATTRQLELVTNRIRKPSGDL